MNALRLVFLALAVGVLGIVGWRSLAPRPAPVAATVPQTAAPPIALLRDAMQAPVPALPGVAALPEVALPAPVTQERPPASASTVATSPEDGLGEVPEFSDFFRRLKDEFPHDYDLLLERLGRTGSSPPRATATIWEALRDLEQAQGVLAAEAEPSVLDRFFDARSALLEGLAPLDARRCVDFLYGVADASLADFTEAHRGLVATLADRTLDAIADGRSHHVERVAPTAADLDALSAGLAARGLSPAETGLLIDGTTPDAPLPDSRICAIGRVYLDVLHGLPAEPRARIYGLAAELLARS